MILPTVSVIVLMSRPGGLDITFAGMRDQTYKDFEVIIVDNRYEKRHQAILDIAKEYGLTNIVHVPEHRRNGKWIVAGAAFNTGFALARGKYIIILHDYAYAPPGWIETHLSQLEGHERRLVVVDHENQDLPEVENNYPLSGWGKDGTTKTSGYTSQQTDHLGNINIQKIDFLGDVDVNRAVTELEDSYLSHTWPDELCIFKKGRFDPSWLPLPIGPHQWQPNFTNLRRSGSVPEHGYISLVNDSMHRSFLLDLNGLDERFDHGRGPMDVNLSYRINNAGGDTVVAEGSKVTLLNPRFLMRSLPFGNLKAPVDGRWSFQDLVNYNHTIRSKHLIRADNPFDIRTLVKELSPWRNPNNTCEPRDISDLAYWRQQMTPETPQLGF